MDYLSRCFLVVFLCSAASGTPPLVLLPTTPGRREVSRGEAMVLPPPYLNLPESVDSRLPLVAKEYFAPAAGTGMEPLMQAVRGILIPTMPPSTRPTSVPGVSVNVTCEPDKVFVQVPKSILVGGGGDVSSRVTVGTCLASMSTADHLLFELDYTSCGIELKISNNQLNYSALLQYDPPQLPGPIRRAAPFTMLISCLYNRHLYSYKIGYKPIMQMRKIFKPMRSGLKFLMTLRNAQWEKLSVFDEYVLGQPMYFEIEAPSLPLHKRLYVHSCYVTPENSHTSIPQFPVIENFGCMVESKDGHSRFIPHNTTAVRFTVNAFLLRGASNQLFMHCNLSVGSTRASPVAKSCNYNSRTKRWVELYGSDLVCACCESTCSLAPSKSLPLSPKSAMISSRSWRINPAVKSELASERKATSTTTTTTTLAAKPQAITQTSVRKTYLQSEVSAGTQKGSTGSVWKHSGPFGVEGMAWIEEDDDSDNNEEKFVAGSSVREKDKIDKVTHPTYIFEDIFGLSK